MAIHKFDFNIGQEQLQIYVPDPKDGRREVSKDSGDPGNHDNRDDLYYDKNPTGIPLGTANQIDDTTNVNYVEEIRETYIDGFHFIDTAIKNYFSGIRIPVNRGNEEYRIMNVKIAGGDVSTLIFADSNLVGGRIKLPVLAITRGSVSYDEKRYSPAKLPVSRIYRNNGRRVELISRGAPYKIDYTLDFWTEYKSDAEYATYSIISRFNPIASCFVSDKTGVTYELIMKMTSNTDTSDIETDAENKAKCTRSVSIQVEGWLPLATKVIPTILSNPVSVNESRVSNNGTVFSGESYFVLR